MQCILKELLGVNNRACFLRRPLDLFDLDLRLRLEGRSWRTCSERGNLRSLISYHEDPCLQGVGGSPSDQKHGRSAV